MERKLDPPNAVYGSGAIIAFLPGSFTRLFLERAACKVEET